MKLFRRRKPLGRERPRQTDAGSGTKVFSYYSKRSDDADAPRQRKENPRAGNPASLRFWQNIPATLASLVIIGGLLYASTLTAKSHVVLIKPSDKAYLRSFETYNQATSKILGNSIFSRSKLTLNTDDVARQLRQRFPELRRVVITIPLIDRTPVVTLEPAEPTMIIEGQGGSFVIDEQGRAMAPAAELPSLGPHVPHLKDETGLPLTIGEKALPEQSVAFITTFVDQLRVKGLTVSALRLPAAANELYISLEGKPYYIKTNIGGDPKQQAGTFLAVKAKLEQDNTPPNEYVDVRVDERAFYK